MTWTRNVKTETTNPRHGKAVTAGFHSETSVSEVVQLLKETVTEIGMSIEHARIECPAKPIKHAFTYFGNDEKRNTYIRSTNMLRKVRGRKLKVTQSMDAEERLHQKRKVYVKCCIHVKHNIPLDFDLHELDTEARISQRPDCDKNVTEYYKKPGHRNRSRRSNGKMAIKKLIATTVSSRETEQRRGDDGKTTSSQLQTATQKNQGSDRGTSEGGGRDKLKKSGR